MSTAPPSAGLPVPPGPPPEPPVDIASRPLTLEELATGTVLYRVHPVRYAHQLLYFGRRSAGRFNAPGGEYGTLYAALDPHAAFLETFVRDPGARLVSLATLSENLLVHLGVTRSLSLASLTGPALRRLGGDTRITSGDHRVAQRWALALWGRPEAVDGLFWRSRFDDSRFNAALFDRAEDALAPTVVGTWDAPGQRALLASILDTYDFALI